MRSTSRFLSLLLLVIVPLLTACSQTVDIYFNPDDSWKVKSRLVFSPGEMLVFREVIQEFLEELTDGAIPSTLLQVDDWSDPALDLLQAYYANEGIDFRWRNTINGYTMEAEGNTFEQFEKLLPGSITVERLDDERFRIHAEFGDLNVFAAMVFKQTIILHNVEILESNAPRQNAYTAVWSNPRDIDVVFQYSDFSPSVVAALICGILLIILAIIYIGYRSKQRNDNTTFDLGEDI